MWKFRPGTEAERDLFLTGLQGLYGVIPELKSCRVLRGMEGSDYDAVLISEFENREALERYTERYTDSETRELFDDMDDSVLRHRYRIHVDDLQQMSATAEAVKAITGVAAVRAAVDIANGFVMARNIATGVAVVLVGILLVVSLFIISNTIRLATFYRREEIAIMKMCGATDAFIRWPFVVEGMILGLAGAVLAFFAQWGVYELAVKLIVQNNGLSPLVMLPYGEMAKNILAAFGVTGFVIGVGGSLMAIRKFLQV